jgi:tetratricopeptide (TPR) repeat protein
MNPEQKAEAAMQDDLKEKLLQGIRLREAGQYEEARRWLLELQADFPEDAQVNYQCAWVHDVLGLEKEAVPFYQLAIQEGLAGNDLRGALLGLGSTYRSLGEVEQAVQTLSRGLELFPNRREFEVFLAMAYYNRGEHSRAMELLLRTLAETSTDEGILRYQRAILFYADKLDQTW